jgi:electron transfer flavoprotein beta subunit
MKIVVILRVAADSSVPLRITAEGFDVGPLQRILNPFDEAALAAAVALKDAGTVQEVIAILTADPQHSGLIPRIFALGAQRTIHLTPAAPQQTTYSTLQQAQLLLPTIRSEAANIILIGREILGDNEGDMGTMLSALLGYSIATNALSLHLGTEEAIITHETADGFEERALRLPTVITAELALATPRYITLMAMAAARKRIAEASTTAVSEAPQITRLALHPVAPRKKGIMLDSVEALAAMIHKNIGDLP